MKKVYLNKEKNNIHSEQSNPRVVAMTHIYDEPSWKYASHRHKDLCELVYVTSGKGIYIIDNKKYEVREGHMIVVNQKTVHSEESVLEDPLCMYCVGIADIHLQGLSENTIIPNGISPVVDFAEKGKFAQYCMEILWNSCVNVTRNSYAICEAMVHALISMIDDEICHLPIYDEIKTQSLASSIQEYIDDNFDKPITLDTIAKAFYVSTDYLSHVMKYETGFSPINYLINRRIGESQRLLLSTVLPINKIAEKVGYPNISHFHNAFKRKLGISPTQFRKMYNMNLEGLEK